MPRSTIGRVHRQVAGDFALPSVTVGEKLGGVIQKFLAGLHRELVVRPLDDSVDRAGLLAEPAIDAFDHVDVVTRRPAGAVVAPGSGFDRDGLRRADRLAELAGDAAFFAV